VRIKTHRLGGLVLALSAGMASQALQAHPSFYNAPFTQGTYKIKCGAETASVTDNGKDTQSLSGLLAQNYGTVDPAKYVTPLNNPGFTGCTPGTHVVDGINIGHGTFPRQTDFSKPYKPPVGSYTVPYLRAYDPSTVDANGNATQKYYIKPPIATDVIFPTGEVTGCAPASASNNAPGENGTLETSNPYAGDFTPRAGTGGKWYTPNAKWTAQPLCRPSVARVLSYTADGQDISPATVPAGYSGVTSITAAVDVKDGFSPTSPYTYNGITFTGGNFGRPTTLAGEVVYASTGQYSGSLPGSGAGPFTVNAPVTTLKGTFVFSGNPYYTQNQNDSNVDGWHGRKPVMSKSGIPVDPVASNGMLGSNNEPGYQIYQYTDYSGNSAGGLPGTAFSFMKTGILKFAPSSCARNIVVRPAYVDRAADFNSTTVLPVHPNEQLINTFFGGRTKKFQVGDAGQQNFWLQYVVLHRDDNDSSWPASCTESQRYDVVVMPTMDQIDNYLIPGFKGTTPCSSSADCGLADPVGAFANLP
jgi:hypothetical protein